MKSSTKFNKFVQNSEFPWLDLILPKKSFAEHPQRVWGPLHWKFQTWVDQGLLRGTNGALPKHQERWSISTKVYFTIVPIQQPCVWVQIFHANPSILSLSNFSRIQVSLTSFQPSTRDSRGCWKVVRSVGSPWFRQWFDEIVQNSGRIPPRLSSRRSSMCSIGIGHWPFLGIAT